MLLRVYLAPPPQLLVAASPVVALRYDELITRSNNEQHDKVHHRRRVGRTDGQSVGRSVPSRRSSPSSAVVWSTCKHCRVSSLHSTFTRLVAVLIPRRVDPCSAHTHTHIYSVALILSTAAESAAAAAASRCVAGDLACCPHSVASIRLENDGDLPPFHPRRSPRVRLRRARSLLFVGGRTTSRRGWSHEGLLRDTPDRSEWSGFAGQDQQSTGKESMRSKTNEFVFFVEVMNADSVISPTKRSGGINLQK